MQIMSQDGCRLVNSDYVKQFYIEKIHEGARLIAETDISIIQLGTYDNIDHAKQALKFINFCLVNPDAQCKCTQAPAGEDVARSGDLFSGGLNPSGLKKTLAHALSLKGDDLESMLKDILN